MHYLNYATLGSIIGHEITHGFDSEGSKFDEEGNLREWWQSEDREKFIVQSKCIANQFSKYTVLKHPLDGTKVLREAIADLGGITLAYHAFHASDEYKTAINAKGLTPDQQFFIAVAHDWILNATDDMKIRLSMDTHPPSKYRINGTLANMPEFQSAFNIQADSPMVNAQRCSIW